MMTLLDTLVVSMYDQCVIEIDRFLYCNFYIMLVKTWSEEVRVKIRNDYCPSTQVACISGCER